MTKTEDDTNDDVNDAGTSVRPATLLESPSTISTWKYGVNQHQYCFTMKISNHNQYNATSQCKGNIQKLDQICPILQKKN